MKNPVKLICIGCFLFLLASGGCTEFRNPTPSPTPDLDEEYPPLVSATGMIVPEKQAALSMLASGMVTEIIIGEGDIVNEGDVLLRLKENEETIAAVSAAELELTSAQIAYDDLMKDAPLNRSRAQLELANAEDAYDKAQDRKNSKAYKVGDQEAIDIAYARFLLAEQIVKDREKEWEEDASWRREDDLIRLDILTRLSQARDERDDALRNYNYLNSLPDDIERSQAEAELEVARQEREKAQEEWNKLKETGVDQEEYNLASDRLENARSQLASAKEQLEKMELSAPFSGTITRIDIHRGEWVEIGQQVMLLADLKQLRVETTDLNEIDTARIKVGDMALVTFDALPDITCNGQVIYIADKSEGSGVNYKVLVELEEIPENVRWGMTAFVDILVE